MQPMKKVAMNRESRAVTAVVPVAAAVRPGWPVGSPHGLWIWAKPADSRHHARPKDLGCWGIRFRSPPKRCRRTALVVRASARPGSRRHDLQWNPTRASWKVGDLASICVHSRLNLPRTTRQFTPLPYHQPIIRRRRSFRQIAKTIDYLNHGFSRGGVGADADPLNGRRKIRRAFH